MKIVAGWIVGSVVLAAGVAAAQDRLQISDLLKLRSVGAVASGSPAWSPIAAVADALLWGRPMPSSDETSELPSDQRTLLDVYRRRAARFQTTLIAPPRATPEEAQVFAQRVGIERAIFSLFDRRDSAKMAGLYALDADLDFAQPGLVDVMLRDLTQKWLAPYLNLVAGDLKLCLGREGEGRRQLVRARDGGHPLIKIVAEQLIREKRCPADVE